MRSRYRPAPSRVLSGVITVAVWLGALWTVWVGVRNGRELQRDRPSVYLGAAPLVGRNRYDGWDWRFNVSLIAAGAIGVVVATGSARGWWFRMRLRWLLIGTAAASMLFATMLALTDGTDGLLYPVEHRTEYLVNLPSTPPGLDYLRSFVHQVDINGYSVHVRGHPPGYLGLLKVLEWIGIGGVWTTAILSIVATGVTAAAVLVVVRIVAGRDWVDRCAPFLVVAPYLIWMATSADAVFTALGAVGTAALVAGATRRGWTAASIGAAGGIILGCLLFGTYLGAVFVIVAAIIVVGQAWIRRFAPLAVLAGAIGGAAVVTVAFRAGGFWWFDGLEQTKVEYLAGTSKFRAWSYFNVGNIAAALIAVGPAVVTGVGGLRDRRIWILAGAAMVAIAASHLSKYTKGEVERIWLPFYPWVTLACGSLFVWRRSPSQRPVGGALWVGVQASFAIVLQAALVSKW